MPTPHIPPAAPAPSTFRGASALLRVISRTSRLHLLGEMASEGLTDGELAQRLGRSVGYVRRELRILRRAGLAVRTMPCARHYLSSAVTARVVGDRIELRFTTSDGMEVVVAWPGPRGERDPHR